MKYICIYTYLGSSNICEHYNFKHRQRVNIVVHVYRRHVQERSWGHIAFSVYCDSWKILQMSGKIFCLPIFKIFMCFRNAIS